jgi:uncharacterized protein
VVTKANVKVDEILASLEALGGRRRILASSLQKPPTCVCPEDWDILVARYRQFIRAKVEAGDVPVVLRGLIRDIIDRRHVHYGCGAGLSEVTVAPDGEARKTASAPGSKRDIPA